MNNTSEKKPEKQNIFLRLLALLVTTALVVGAVLLVVYRDRFNVDALKRWATYRSLETSPTGEAEPFNHAGGDKLSLAYLESGIVQSSTSGVHYYSFSGEQYAEEVLAMVNPVMSTSDRSAVVYDAGGQSLFLFQNGVEAFDLTLKGNSDLLSARVNSNGWLAVTAQQSGYKGAVTVYDDTGEKVIQISLSSTFVVDAILSPDCKTVAVVTMDQKGGSFFSQVLFYPVNKTEPTGQVELGNMVVLDLDYESGRLWVLGEDRITILSNSSDEPIVHDFERAFLKGCDFGGDGFALLLTGRYRNGGATQVTIVGPDGTAQAVLDPGAQVLSFDSAGSYCSILTGSHLNIYTRDLDPYATLNSTMGARYTALADNGSALLANEQKAWLYIPG